MSKSVQFNEGDTVQIIRDCSGCIKGELATLRYGFRRGGDEETLFAYSRANEDGQCSCQHNWRLHTSSKPQNSETKTNSINNSKTLTQKTMNLFEKFSMTFTPEPEKSFRKAGVTNEDGSLTTQGAAVFLSWLLKKHGEEFKSEVVDAFLKEDKEGK